MSTYNPTPVEPSTLAVWEDGTGTLALGSTMSAPLKTLADNVAWLKQTIETMQATMQTIVPVGTIIMVPYLVIPAGFLELDGSAVLNATYPALTDLLWCGAEANPSATWGYRCSNSNGTGRTISGQYTVLPNARGEFFRGFDNGRGADSSRSLWAAQSDAMGLSEARNGKPVLGVFVRTARTTQSPVTPAIDGLESGGHFSFSLDGGETDLRSVADADNTLANYAAETRSRNLAALFCIKY